MIEEGVILAAIAQEQIVDMAQANVFSTKFAEPYGCLISAAYLIYLRGDPVTLLSLSAECKLSDETWAQVRQVWNSAKAEQRINWKPAAERIIERNMTEIAHDVAGLLQQTTYRGGVQDAIARTIVKLQSTLENSYAYNPSPSHHYLNGVIGDLTGTSGIKGIDHLLQGGLWTQALIINGMPSNHGKSTLAYSMLAASAKLGRRCNLFTFETNTSTAVARLLSAFGGWTLDETVKRQGSTEERHAKMMEDLKRMDEFITIYDNDFNDPKKIESVLRIERPELSVVDHLGIIDPSKVSTANRSDIAGDIADAALQWTIKYSMTMLLNSQLDNVISAELKKTHDLKHTKLFGSSRIYNAADFVVIGLRHWSKPRTAYYRSKKNRKNGIVDLEVLLDFDPYTHSYRDAR